MSIEIINTALGLEYSDGNEELYLKLLCRFLKEQQETPMLLEKAIHNKNFVFAYKLAHTVKSVAITIGAVSLSEYLSVLEGVLKENGESLDSNRMEDCKNEFYRVLDYISRLKITTESCKDTIDVKQLDKERAYALANEIRPRLERGEGISDGTLDSIREILMPMGEKCETLIARIEDYDFEQAVITLDEIVQIIRKGRL